MNNSTYKSVSLLAEGKIYSELHYGPYARDWWSPRPSNNNVSVSVPYRLHMHISIVLNQRQFFIKVVQNEENKLQPGFICASGNETSKVCLTPSQAVNSVYHIIFGKKTAYSGPAILGFNDEKIVKKLLTGVVFRPLFLNIGKHVVVVSKIEDQKFTSSVLTKKSQKTLALQKINHNVFTLDFYKSEQILWHYEDQSANGVWAQAGIAMQLDGESLYGFNHPSVQYILQTNLADSYVTCTSENWDDPYTMENIFEQQIKRRKIATNLLENWQNLFITWIRQENTIIEGMLSSCGCADITPYSKSEHKEEFWSRSKDPTTDKANLKMLYEFRDSESLENSEDLEENTFWNSFQNALMVNKRGQNGKTRILSIIADQFTYKQLRKKLQVSSKTKIRLLTKFLTT
ncbi:1456_t:CDS:2 [Cetraspora pellucida]|uniref:1456_t:CDS:1 n=1 Tax=Cetraspora pellucida TaxID=1433469 RepID=A0ACA9K5T4_9GLOM|nr:1456_t:CDS:2 [Cetraspora pellucida]